jgi:hypothetical protein
MLDWCVGFTMITYTSKFPLARCFFHAGHDHDSLVGSGFQGAHKGGEIECSGGGTDSGGDCQCFIKPKSSIKSGDVIFLKTHAGEGNYIGIEDVEVHARWSDRGNSQALVIESSEILGSNISTAGAVFLRSIAGKFIGVQIAGEFMAVQGATVEARFHERGALQALAVEKAAGDDGNIFPDDIVCFKVHTGQHIDVEQGSTSVRARFDDCGLWQQMLLQRENPNAIFSGQLVYLKSVYTGRNIDVENTWVSARWQDHGALQKLTIDNLGGRVIYCGDIVFITAHTGKQLDVETSKVQARYQDRGKWQQFVIEKIDSVDGPIFPGDRVFLRAHTGKFLHASKDDFDVVGATWADKGEWQTMIIEVDSTQN